jgi:hypothetical protein
MKITKVLAVAAALSLIAACGGGGTPGPTPTPTTAAQQAASGASVSMALEAGGQATIDALMPSNLATMIAPNKAAVPIDVQIDYPGTCDPSGTYQATGRVTGTCDIVGDSGTCTGLNSTVDVVFTACVKEILIGGAPFTVQLDGGPAHAIFTGSITGNAAGPTSTNIAGSVTGTVGVGGDAVGTVLLDGISFTVTGSEPDIGCTGTCSVTLDGGTAAICGVNTTCDGCTQ